MFQVGGNSNNSPEVWFKSLPPVTKFYLTTGFILTLLFTVGLISVHHFLLNWVFITRKLQLWRIWTDYLFVGPFSFSWLMHMYLFVSFSSRLELNEIFASTHNPGAYLFFMAFQSLLLSTLSLIIYYPTGKPIMSQALVTAIIYYWSRREPWGQVGLWGFSIQAYQLPFALLLMDLLMGNSIIIDIMGLVSGHIFYFLQDVLPHEKNIHFFNFMPMGIFNEIMMRATQFSIKDIQGSILTLLKGGTRRDGTNRPNQRQVAPPQSTSRTFSGAGYRLGTS